MGGAKDFKVTDYFESSLVAMGQRDLKFCFFGDSLLDRPSIVVDDPHYDLPAVGSDVTVRAHETAGFYKLLQQHLQIAHPERKLNFLNFAKGGSTVKDTQIQFAQSETSVRYPDVSFFCVGINDIWRKFQGRFDEAVAFDEFSMCYENLLMEASKRSKLIFCIGEPIGSIGDQEDEVNGELSRYNELINSLASSPRFDNVFYIDLFSEFQQKNMLLKACNPEKSLWIDGVHLSDIGNVLAATTIIKFLEEIDIEGKIF